MWKLEKNGDPKYFIEGPGRLTSALETLSASSSKLPSEAPPKDKQTPSSSLKNTGNNSNNNGMLACRTIVASDNDVSNGFVKDGKALPYVFEATESGLRKRSNKILPVCGVCGKKFVCVTTMKRHLVTHTGEKPFSCKVCGKQYTQKGNLRVHERTHRNDRPFECNICHQKFYRKEPMQKHQWRQHAIVHFKSRPTNPKEDDISIPQVVEEPAFVRSVALIQSQGDEVSLNLPPSTPLDPLASTQEKEEEETPPTFIGTQEQQKPCLKHKMKLAQAYLREQRELGENLSSSGRDIVGLLNLSLKESSSNGGRFTCKGCSFDFESGSALLIHVRPLDEKDEPSSSFKCCQCSQEFSQRTLLLHHQEQLHAPLSNLKPPMTFTMQELIERGVEKSMKKGIDDVAGRMDERTASSTPPLSFRSPSPSQPLDLSPGKSLDMSKEEILASRANNPLLNNRPFNSLEATSSSSSTGRPPLSPAYKKLKTTNEEPNETNGVTTTTTIHLPIGGKQPLKLASWKGLSTPYIKSDFVRSSDQMHLKHMDRNRPQDGRTV